MAGCTETFACGHEAAETAVCETEGCDAEACAQCALRGRESEVLGEGPLGPGAPGPFLIPGVEQFSYCDGCGAWQCAVHKNLCSCGDVICDCGCEYLATCDTCGEEGHPDCMRSGCGCLKYETKQVCINCPSQEDDGYAKYLCCGVGDCTRSSRKSVCTLCIDNLSGGEHISICECCEEVTWSCNKHEQERNFESCCSCEKACCDSCLRPCSECDELVCSECKPLHLEIHAEEEEEEEEEDEGGGAEEGGAAGGATSPTLTGKREREGSEGAACKRAK
jgi:hypothetical protein